MSNDHPDRYAAPIILAVGVLLCLGCLGVGGCFYLLDRQGGPLVIVKHERAP